MLNAARDSDFLYSLYGCCAGRAQWPNVLNKLCIEFGAVHVMLQGLTLDHGRLEGNVKVTSNDDLYRAYEAQVSDTLNPRFEAKRLVQRAVGRVVTDEQLFDIHEADEKRVFHQRLLALGAGPFIGGLIPRGNTGDFLGIAMHKPARESEPFRVEEQNRLQELLPHLGQAFLMWEQMNVRSSLESILAAQANHYPFGIAVCDTKSRLLWMNTLAEKLLPPAPQTRGVEAMTLKGWNSQQTETLHNLVSARISGSMAEYVVLKDNRGADIHIAIKSIQVPKSASAYALLIITYSEMINEIPIAALQAFFGLTQAEARLARHLACGGTLERYAVQQGIALTTVRWHVKQILAKTQSGRQSELVRKILCSAAYHAGISVDLISV